MNGAAPEKSEARHFRTKSHKLSIAAIEAAQRELDYTHRVVLVLQLALVLVSLLLRLLITRRHRCCCY